MKRPHRIARLVWLFLVLSSALGVGCGGGSKGGAAAPLGGALAPPPGSSGTTTPVAPLVSGSLLAHPVLLPGRAGADGRFLTSNTCAECHSNAPQATALRDSAGNGIAPLDLWEGSMMANAVRDPLFRAQVSAEIAATPSRAREISNKCLTCHAPMASANAKAAGTDLDLPSLQVDSERTQVALDGVSCTFCHALQPDPAQLANEFSGNYKLGTPGLLFGPHAAPFETPMRNRSGFIPVQSDHMTKSTLCASCHTLYTKAFDASGALTGAVLPEQTPYLEWQNSIYTTETATPGPQAASCQSCHVPTRDAAGNPIRTAIARTPNGGDYGRIGPRDPVGRHLYVGGNTLVPEILKRERAELNPKASDASFDAVVAAARAQLQRDTASLNFGPVSRSGDRLRVALTAQNRAGHKFPTGHPVRRAWLRLVVRDALGALVFSSGAFDSAGRIVDSAGAVLTSEVRGGPVQPHHAQIDDDHQVQIYQSLMADGKGDPTWLLLRGDHYLKDNRLLPQGWSPSHPAAADTKPEGIGGDPNFSGGGDTLAYEFSAPPAKGPYQISATLLYQPLSARYASELFAHQTPEVKAFEAYYLRATRTPESVAQAQTQAP